MARNDSTTLKMKDLLIKRRDALRKALAGDLSLLKQMNEQASGDVVDFAIDAAQDEINSQLAEVESRELGNIEKALDRMKLGVYGRCEVCTDKIAVARLNALPYATMCIECQRASEDGTLDDRRVSDWSNVSDGSEAEVSLTDLEM